MLRYMRSSEPKGDGNETTNAASAAAAVSSPASDSAPRQASPTRPGAQQSSQAMHAPLPAQTRQQLAEAAKLHVPSPSRAATPARQSPPKHSQYRIGSQPPPPPPTQPDQQQQQIWEDSSINSMFAESVATTTRPASRVVPVGRYGSQQQQQRRGRGRDVEEAIATAAVGDDAYAERSPFGSPSRHVPVTKPSKYALRDSRRVNRHTLSTERPAAETYDDAGRGSPEQRVHQRGGPVETTSLGAGLGGPGLGLGGLGLGTGNLQGGFFRNTAPHQPDNDEQSDMGLRSESEASNQRTPRQNRAPAPDAPAQQQQPALLHKRALQDSSLPRVGGGTGVRRDRKQNRKRNHSPDYDDSVLHAMSFSELRDEPFDHDPSRVAVQAPAVPANLSIEDRLLHFKTKEATSQRHFFTEMTMQEWDESGDWFLDQFAELSNKIRAKRQEKRRKMAEFEAEITERENTVRHKAESIERTLGDLRNEGEGMMRNKVVDF